MEAKHNFIPLLCIFIIGIVKCQERVVLPDMNNVWGYIDNPGDSAGNVKYLGKFESTEECIRACESHRQGRCLTFTFHTTRYEGPFRGQCYGGIEEPLWSPMPERGVDSGRIFWPCRSGMDCSLNGKCEAGRCQCRKAWRGHRCDELNLLPAKKDSGYHYMEDGRNISSWGGGVLRSKDGKYHMYAAEITEHCGINSWTLNSQLIHGVSDEPLGTYKRVGIIRPPFAHEPDVATGPSGEFVLFWSENKYQIPLCKCSDGSTTPGCKMPHSMFWTYMSYSMNPDGPWSDPVPVVSPNATRGDNNFAPVILKDGSLVGFTRSGKWGNPDHGGSRIHLLTATNWKEPSTYKQRDEELWPYLPSAGTEDPFMYLDGDGYFHAIFHNMWPNNIQESCGGHAYSRDGKTWVYGGRAFGNRVEFTDGTSFTFTRRERPHFVFAEDGFTPLALTNGAQYGGKYGDATYTLLQPVLH